MSARFKVDEDLPRQMADLLIAHGHDAATVMRQWCAQATISSLLI
jgi:hypothetical protein